MANNVEKPGETAPMDVSDSEEESVVERPGAPTTEELELLRKALQSVGTSLAASTAAPTTSAPGGSGTPTLSSSSPTPPPPVKGNRSMVVSPELLEQFHRFLTIQGGAPAPQQLPPALSLGAPGPSRSVAAVPVLPPVLVAPAPPLPVMPRQAPAPGSVLLGAAMAASSPVLDLERLVTNQALMARHQHKQTRESQLKAAELKVVIS